MCSQPHAAALVGAAVGAAAVAGAVVEEVTIGEVVEGMGTGEEARLRKGTLLLLPLPLLRELRRGEVRYRGWPAAVSGLQ